MSASEPVTYNKLVRDLIPDIIRSSGRRPVVERLMPGAYRRALHAKLAEEAQELEDEPCAEELADVLEVLMALAAAYEVTWEEVARVREAKLLERGGFERALLLREVHEGEA